MRRGEVYDVAQVADLIDLYEIDRWKEVIAALKRCKSLPVDAEETIRLLMGASFWDQTDVVRELIRLGVDLDTIHMGRRAIRIAAHRGKVATVRMLLKHHVKLDGAQAWNELSALHYACIDGHEDPRR